MFEKKSYQSSNQLFLIALEGVDEIEGFAKLSTKGRCEALIFVGGFVYNMALKYEELNRKPLTEDFLNDIAMTVKKSMFFKGDEFVIGFVNNRFKFYMDEYDLNRRERYYTPMFIYNAFYMNPFVRNPNDIKTFNLNPLTLMDFKNYLFLVADFIENHSFFTNIQK